MVVNLFVENAVSPEGFRGGFAANLKKKSKIKQPSCICRQCSSMPFVPLFLCAGSKRRVEDMKEKR